MRDTLERRFWVNEMPIFVALDDWPAASVDGWGLDGFGLTVARPLRPSGIYRARISLTAGDPVIADLQAECVAFDDVSGAARLRFLAPSLDVFHQLYGAIEEAFREIRRHNRTSA